MLVAMNKMHLREAKNNQRDTFCLKVLIIHIRLRQIFTAFVFSLQICISVLIGVKSLRVTVMLLKR